MSWFFWFWVLPFVLVMIMLPKCSAANLGEHKPNYNNPIRVKNVLLALVAGSIPVLNIITIFVCTHFYMSHYDEAFDNDFFNKNLVDFFSRKKQGD